MKSMCLPCKKITSLTLILLSQAIYANTQLTVPFFDSPLSVRETMTVAYAMPADTNSHHYITCVVLPNANYNAEWTYQGKVHKKTWLKEGITFSTKESVGTELIDTSGEIKITNILTWDTEDFVGNVSCFYHT